MTSSRAGRRAALTAVAALVIAIVAAGCGSLPGLPSSDRASTPPGSASSSAPPDDAAVPANPGTCTQTDCPRLPVPSGTVPESGVTTANADTAVPKYMRTILDDLDRTWSGWFEELRWGQVTAGRHLVGPGQRFTTSCVDENGKRTTVGTDFPNAFFCGRDVGRDGDGRTRRGSVVLPVQTFADIWNDTLFQRPSAFLGDFSAAIIMAHEYGHNVAYRIAKVHEIPDARQPTGNNPELLADCFAGNWAATVFSRQRLSARDMVDAVSLIVQVADIGPGQGHGTIPERVAALGVGFRGPSFNRQGQPVDCLSRYWPSALQA